MEEDIYLYLVEVSANKSKAASKNEFQLFEATRKSTESLELHYKDSTTIKPTSVENERVYLLLDRRHYHKN